MNTSMFDFNLVQMSDNSCFDVPILAPLSTPLYPTMSFDDIDMIDLYTFHPQPINIQIPEINLTSVTDIFGFTHICDPMSVDIMSGLPTEAFPKTTAVVAYEQNCAKLEESSNLKNERDIAVENYHDAIRNGDYDEALKWERLANERQSSLYELWDTPKYFTGPVIAEGL